MGKKRKILTKAICLMLVLLLSMGSAVFAYADVENAIDGADISVGESVDVPESNLETGNENISTGVGEPSDEPIADGSYSSKVEYDYGKNVDDNILYGYENSYNVENDNEKKYDYELYDEGYDKGYHEENELEYETYACNYCEFGCELCIFKCDCEYDCECGMQTIMPFGFSVIASGTMNDLPGAGTNLTTRVEGTATWRIEQRYAPEHPFLTYVRTLYIGTPGVVGTLNRPGEMFPPFAIRTPWQWGGFGDHNDVNTREITRIVFEGPVVAGVSLFGLFNDMSWIESIENIHYLDTSATVSMAYMFRNVGATRNAGHNVAIVTPTLSRLQLDLSTFDTSNVTSMHQMFAFASVDYLNLSGWDTSSVTTMYGMFQGVHYLENLDVSHFNTSNVTTMARMFSAHSSNALANPQDLRRNSFLYLDVSNFDTSNVTSMAWMFYGSQHIKRLDLRHFDLSSLDPTSTSALHRTFQGMHSLVELDISTWDTSVLHPGATNRMFINNLAWPGRDSPTAAQNTANIRILHLGPNFRFSSGAGNPSSFLPNVPGGNNIFGNPVAPHEWMGQWQEIGTGTVDRPNGIIRTSAQLMANNLPMEGTWVWRPRIYQINFEGNGTVEVPAVGTMTPGAPRHPNFNENYTLANNEFSRDGYTFAGWNTAANGTGTAFPDGHTFAPWAQASNMTLFAQWTQNQAPQQIITFNPNGGLFVGYTAEPWPTRIVQSGAPNTYAQAFTATGSLINDALAIPTRTGFTFGGWFDTQAYAGGTTQDGRVLLGDIVTDESTRTLWARWIQQDGPNPPNGGGGGGGGTIIAPEDPPLVFIADHIWYVRGFPEGDFRPGNSITRAEISMILWRLLDSAAKYTERTNNFSDVSTGWYARAVSYLAFRGIVQGYPDGTFRPNAPITRAELTAVMSRFFELYENGTHNFNDVSGSHWAIMYINNAVAKGWVEGFPDGSFRPDNSTTRAEAVTLLNRVLGRIPNPVTIRYHLYPYLEYRRDKQRLFTDLMNTHWAYYQIMEAAVEHIFTLDENGLEIWSEVSIPWLDIDSPRI